MLSALVANIGNWQKAALTMDTARLVTVRKILERDGLEDEKRITDSQNPEETRFYQRH